MREVKLVRRLLQPVSVSSKKSKRYNSQLRTPSAQDSAECSRYFRYSRFHVRRPHREKVLCAIAFLACARHPATWVNENVGADAGPGVGA